MDQITKIENLFNDNNKTGIILSNIHKSKGLEWSVVKLANDFKVPSDGAVPSQEETNKKLDKILVGNNLINFCWYCSHCNKNIVIKNLFDVIKHEQKCIPYSINQKVK